MKYTFEWRGEAVSVSVCTSSDQWVQHHPLKKSGALYFTVTLDIKPRSEYKYIVDGEWIVNESASVVRHENGVVNNVIDEEDWLDLTVEHNKRLLFNEQPDRECSKEECNELEPHGDWLDVKQTENNPVPFTPQAQKSRSGTWWTAVNTLWW